MLRFRFYVLFFISFFLTWGCREKEEARPIVEVERASTDDIEFIGKYVGRIRAAQYVEVRARVEGYLEKAMFEEGKRIEQNDPLFHINQAQYKARVEKAKAQLKKDMAQAAKAQRDVERLRPLYEQNAASQLDLDNAVSALENAEANVAMSKADLEQAELELSYTVVVSPLTGYISERYVDVGTLVGPNNKSLLASVMKSDTVFVEFKMTALDYLKSTERNVKLGELDSTRSWQPTVKVTLADDSEYPIKGIVDFADPEVDPQTGTFGVRAVLPNPDQKLLPGQYTRVKLLLDVKEDAVVVPRKAVTIEKGGAFVYVIRRDSVAEKRFLQTGPELENTVVAERGLNAGEMVVIEGMHKLSPGIKVIPIESGDEQAIERLKREVEP